MSAKRGRPKLNSPFVKNRTPLKIGYARVSTTKQDLTVQRKLLKDAGCDYIAEEKISGAADLEERRELFHLLDALIEGDELVIYDLSRLSRKDTQEAMILLWQIRDKGVQVTTLDGKLDFDNEWSDVIAMILTKINKLEREKIKERTRLGRIRAKENGVQFGRKSIITDDKRAILVALYRDGRTYSEIADAMGISKSTVGKTVLDLVQSSQLEKR